ncbi:WNK lysine deficient protein kinase [Paragonimus westermani]|uniref:WNK lysine deficient protein kinase n=1 Tax=Paragonimus westermani TaxID=34504 RepID=A0A5J4NSB5_9TREM|nr:WNK lysine deficient protein kinase [Paragonimus westermani]
MNVNLPKTSTPKEDPNAVPASTALSDLLSSCETSEATVLNGDKSVFRIDTSNKVLTKKVKIVDPGPVHDVESDDEDSLSQAGMLERSSVVSTGECAAPAAPGQATDSQAAAAERKKSREERKKEREKKKEEEMLKKYQAEQEAKQKVSAKSKCGRWIKHNLKREHVDTKEKRQAMFKETEIMLRMNHPHIVRCFDVFREWIDVEDPNNQMEEKGVVIIQELMGEGTLKSVIRKNFLEGQCILKFPLITRWWHQILDALRYMHHKIQPPILHRDLKADNCFLYGASDEEYLNVKVGDFGLATHVNNSGRKTMLDYFVPLGNSATDEYILVVPLCLNSCHYPTVSGTLGFMAPEIFDEKYDEKVDIYAFGMLMLEVMTNRTPYDECETVMQVAAKTMSGQGPDIMDKVLNPSLREVISACIHPLTCFRPTSEELYFHPLFQPKTLPVEVEPNYDNATDRAEVLDRFVRSLDNAETRDPNFNLRLRFRDKKMLQELGLDDGESLEFDLDIYKAEDQDIPDLIHNLRLGYEDKLWRVFENPKQPDKKIVSSHLDKLFSSIRLQMQFLVKVLLGKRWKAILDSLVDEQRSRKKLEGSSTVDDEDNSDTDACEPSSFTAIGKYKGKWSRAKRMLEKEIQAYRNATNATASVGTAVGTASQSVSATGAVPVSASSIATSASVSAVPVPAQVDNFATGSTLTASATATHAPTLHPVLPQHPITTTTNSTIPEMSDVATTVSPEVSAMATGVNVTTVGKFCVSTPVLVQGMSPSDAPVNGFLPQSAPPPVCVPQGLAQHVGLTPQVANSIGNVLQQSTSQSTQPVPSHQVPVSLDNASGIMRLLPDQSMCQTALLPNSALSQLTGNPILSMASSQLTQHVSTSHAQTTQTELVPMQPTGKPDVDPGMPTDLDSVALSAVMLQQVIQGIAANSLKSCAVPSDGTHSQPTTPQVPATTTAPYSFNIGHPGQFLNQQQQAIVAAVAAAAAAAAAAATSASPSQTTGQHYSTQDPTVMRSQRIPTSLIGVPQSNDSTYPKQSFLQLQPCGLSAGLMARTADNSGIAEQDVTNKMEAACRPDSIHPVLLLNQLTEALLSASGSTGLGPHAVVQPATGGSTAFVNPLSQQQSLYQSLVSQQASLHSTPQSIPVAAIPTSQQQQLAQIAATLSSKQIERKQRRKSKSKPRYILRVTKIERDSEGNNDPASLRPTFYLEMPDFDNPNSELWKLSFRCNLSDTPDDIKLFQGAGYTPANEDIDRAAKEAVVQVLDALRTDINSVKLNQDYVFYPRPIAQVPPGSTVLGLPLADQGTNVHEEDDELSESSRPLSPSDAATALPFAHPLLAQHPLLVNSSDSSVISHSSLASSATPYFTTSLCGSGLTATSFSGGMLTDATLGAASAAVAAPVDHSDSTILKRPLLPLSMHYVTELLSSLTSRQWDHTNTTVNGFQSGLEEVTPLAPPSSDLTIGPCAPSAEFTSMVDCNTGDPSMGITSDSQAYARLDSTSFRASQLSRASSINQNRMIASMVPASNQFEPETMINFTCTIPASLENIFRELTTRLCSTPVRPVVLLPVALPLDGSLGTASIRITDIPQGHVFLGLPASYDYTSPFHLTTFKACSGSTLIVLRDLLTDGQTVSIPRIYHTPSDAAVVLSPNGAVHCLDKAALVVPVQSNEAHRCASPPLSPGSEATGSSKLSHQGGSVQVRELPIHPNMDTLTLDDVLNLLLALRSTSQQLHRSNTTSPTIDTYTVTNPSVNADVHPVTSTTSRRSSAAGTSVAQLHTGQSPHYPHYLTHPALQLAQLHQLSLGRQQRVAPHFQQAPSQLLPAVQPSNVLHHPEQPQIQTQPPSVSSNRFPVPFNTVGLDTFSSIGSAFTSPPTHTLPNFLYSQHSTQTVPLTQSGLTPLQLRFAHEHTSVGPPQLPAMFVSPSNAQSWSQQQLLPQQPSSLITQPAVPDLSQLNAANVQQAINFLSSVVHSSPAEQLPSILAQLARNTTVPVTAVGSSCAVVHGKQGGQGSPTSGTLHLGMRPTTSSQQSATVAFPSAASPPVHLPMSGGPYSGNIGSFPMLLNRFLTPNAMTAAEWVNEQAKANPVVPSVGTVTRPVLVTPHQFPPTTGSDTAVVNHLGQNPACVAVTQPRRNSHQVQPVDHSTQQVLQNVSLDQHNLQNLLPELLLALRILRQSETSVPREQLIEAQHRLLAAAQPHSAWSPAVAVQQTSSVLQNQPVPLAAIETAISVAPVTPSNNPKSMSGSTVASVSGLYPPITATHSSVPTVVGTGIVSPENFKPTKPDSRLVGAAAKSSAIPSTVVANKFLVCNLIEVLSPLDA